MSEKKIRNGHTRKVHAQISTLSNISIELADDLTIWHSSYIYMGDDSNKFKFDSGGNYEGIEFG
jgi:hypothetical protein